MIRLRPEEQKPGMSWRPPHVLFSLLILMFNPLCGICAEAVAQGVIPRGASILITQSPRSGELRTSELDASSHFAPPQAGSRVTLLEWTGDKFRTEALTPGFESAARPRLSFDALRMLFVGRQNKSERFGVWELELAGGQPREVVRCDGDCIQAEYLTTLYTLDGTPTPRIAVAHLPDGSMIPSIFTCNTNGTDQTEVTYSPHGAGEPYSLQDGRLLFRIPTESTPKSDHRERADSQWFTVGIDGTDLRLFIDSQRSRANELDLQVREGELAAQHARVETRLPWKVHWNGDRLVAKTSPATNTLGIFSIGNFIGTSELVFDSAEWDELDPVVVEPVVHTSGFSSALRGTQKTGQIYCLDAYTSERGSPRGPKIQSVRILTTASGPAASKRDSAVDSNVPEKLLGTAKVESDGSFFITVPSGTPLRFETIGPDGQVLRSMQSWMWVMPGEHRGCVGCHEDPGRAPPNRHVFALRRNSEILVAPTTSKQGASENISREDRP